jgi:hypothetical protein
VSINRRTALAVRSLGVASAAAALALGVAGNAFACQIGDFTASVACDQQSGNGVITVHDTDGTRPVTITVKTDDGTVVVPSHDYTNQGDFTISMPWQAKTHYDLFVTVKNHFQDKQIAGGVTTGDQACGTHTTPSTTPPTTPETTPPTTAAAATTAPSTSVAAVAATVPAPSPSANLAETGGGSNTGMLVGIAGALVVAGGGTVFMLRRRTAGAHH